MRFVSVVFYIVEMCMRSPRIQGGSLHFHKHLSFLELLRDWEIGAKFHDLSRVTPGGGDPSVLCVGNCGHDLGEWLYNLILEWPPVLKRFEEGLSGLHPTPRSRKCVQR